MTHILKFIYLRLFGTLRRMFWWVYLRSVGCRLGHGADVYGGARIVPHGPGAITIGDRFRMLRNATVNTLGPSGCIRIGSNVHVGESTMITAHSRVTIGDDTIIGPQNMIVDVDHVIEDRDVPIRSQGLLSRPITIGANVWISSHCIILKGVTIGRGAVLGAGAVVTHDVPPFAVMVGNPARVIRYWGDDPDDRQAQREAAREVACTSDA